jgi:hypothetical protein
MNKKHFAVGFFVFCSLISHPFISSAKSEKDVNFLVPGKNFSPVSCDIFNGTISTTDNTYTDDKGVVWGYDKYSFKPQLGKIIFIEVIVQDKNQVGLTYHWADMQNMPNIYTPISPTQILQWKNRFAAYIDTNDKSSLNLYVSRRIYGNYVLRVSTVNPINNVSKLEVDKVVDDFSPLSSLDNMKRFGYRIRGEDDPEDLVNMKDLCQK